MGVEKEGIMEVKKKDKKSKKKSKKGEQNEVSDNGIYETKRGGKDEVMKGGKSVGAKDGDRGDIEKKKKKGKHKIGEDSGEKSKEDKKNEVGSIGIYETLRGGESEGGKCAEKEDGDRGDTEKKKKKKQKVGEHCGEKAKEDKKNEVSNNGIYESEHDGENEDIEKKKVKKHKVGEHTVEKYRKKEVRNNGIYGSEHDGENEVIEGRNSAEKEDAERGDIEKKKKKKRRVGEDNSDGYREIEKGNDDGKRFELGGGRKDDGNVGEKVERKKIKREKDKNIGSVYHGQDQDCEDAKDGRQSSMDRMYVNEIENAKGNEAIGQALDGDIVAKVEKRKEEREIVGFGSGDPQQDDCYVATNGTQEKKRQRGKLEAFDEDCEPDSIEKREKKRRKREKKNENDVSAAIGLGILAEEDAKGNANSTMNEKLDKNIKNGSKGKKKKAKLVENRPEDPKPKKNKKRVSFSGNVEVFPSSDDPSVGMENNEDNLIRGKRFSKEEDEIVKEAVFKYIDAHFLGEEGLKMVLNCKSYPEIKNCWKEISTCLPNRPHSSIYYRAQVLFRRDEKRKWTEEEIEFLRKFQETQGQQNQWKVLADELGKHRFHVKDTWRRIKHKTMKKGRWSQEEYQALFDLVNSDLSMKYSEEKKSKHGMLRDNIAWTAISDKLSTRSSANCCLKWYGQLTSDMVDEGVWANADDYRLIDALFRLDASCIEDVDWDNLLDNRLGDVCRKRWKQMVLHIGDNRNNSFADQVDILAKRYCPDLLEAREAWDSKPVVP